MVRCGDHYRVDVAASQQLAKISVTRIPLEVRDLPRLVKVALVHITNGDNLNAFIAEKRSKITGPLSAHADAGKVDPAVGGDFLVRAE